MQIQPPKIEVKTVKHVFTPDERADVGNALAVSLGDKRNVEAEFDQVKQSYKARLTEHDTRIIALSTDLVNGFAMRNERCVINYIPAKRVKNYYLESEALPDKDSTIETFLGLIDAEKIKPVLSEPMTSDDFQTELLQAESKFDHRCEIQLFNPTGSDYGTLVVGKFGQRWYSALRIKIGRLGMDERLDSEQKSFKSRVDAVKRAGKRAMDWIEMNFKDNAKGFEEPIAAAIKAQLERVEQCTLTKS